jgi:hypothetical protein
MRDKITRVIDEKIFQRYTIMKDLWADGII